MSARDTALAALIACRRQNAWSDGALHQLITRDRLDRRDAALASRLCYGVLQNRSLLDHWIGLFLKDGTASLQPAVLDVLRLAVYQLQFLDKIPPSAVVNEAVNQTKRLTNAKAAGLVNAVLRNILRAPDRLSLPEDPATRYSHPQGLVDLLRENVGEEKLEALLSSHNSIPGICLQVNTLCTDAKAAAAELEAEGYAPEPHPWLPDCIVLKSGAPEQSRAFRNGLYYVQDAAARLAVLAAALQPGMRVMDCCAAPGGKSFAAAICMQNRGSITACDIHAHKIPLIERSAERLGIRILSAMVQDAGEPRPEWKGAFDAVLADVPCSGLGVIRKKPDIRYKDLRQMEGLPAVQRRILNNQAAYVRPGGLLLYSTCTILRRENEAIVEEFLGTHPEFAAEAFSLPGTLQAPDGMLTLLPCDQGTDGFFIARLRRNG